jgi:quinol monooxygenase YgiN
MKPTVCLNMIVRDEAHVIERCLASVRPHIDSWVIVDTGSLDDTPQRIAAALAGVPGQLHHRPWKNFGHNRTEALELARGQADYLLFIDADETLGAEPGTRWPALSGPAHCLEVRYGELRYDRMNLVSTQLPWRWEGVLHEHLEAGYPVAQPRVPGFWTVVNSDGARSGDPQKFAKDAAVLAAALKDEPGNARYVFYLAQSWRDAGQPEQALASYQQRASMGGWDEEVWYSLYECARLRVRLGQPYEAVVAAHLKAHQARPQRAEALTALATYLRGLQEWHTAYLFAQAASQIPVPNDRLFVDVTAYHWRAPDELALAAFYTGRKEQAAQLWKGLLAGPHLPAADRVRIEANLGFALNK